MLNVIARIVSTLDRSMLLMRTHYIPVKVGEHQVNYNVYQYFLLKKKESCDK